MNKQEHLLTILSEECAEVAHRCSKALRFTMDEVQPGQDLTNKERILEELTDLIAVAEMVFDGPISSLIRLVDIVAKQEKVAKYLNHSSDCGTLDPHNAVIEKVRPLVEAAEGLSLGIDWNHGTHAKVQGYRRKLLDALPAAKEAVK